MDEVNKIANKVTYKFERICTYEDGEMYTDAKLYTMDAFVDNFYDAHGYAYAFLRSAFGHVEAPQTNFKTQTFQEAEVNKPCSCCDKRTMEDWK